MNELTWFEANNEPEFTGMYICICKLNGHYSYRLLEYSRFGWVFDCEEQEILLWAYLGDIQDILKEENIE